MGKGDIRTRRGKVWRGTYGVTRPRRWKTVVRPAATTRKVKALKDLPKAASEPVKKPVAETVKQEGTQDEIVNNNAPSTNANDVSAETTTADPKAGATEKKPAKKATAAKKPAVKKAPTKKKEEN